LWLARSICTIIYNTMIYNTNGHVRDCRDNLPEEPTGLLLLAPLPSHNVVEQLTSGGVPENGDSHADTRG
jgi:hypothetical protein